MDKTLIFLENDKIISLFDQFIDNIIFQKTYYDM